jgi:hypothetical protein
MILFAYGTAAGVPTGASPAWLFSPIHSGGSLNRWDN